ncbi:prepilin-type N-terminal cleavage/methylation domain-containing protein [Thermoanaerobacter uzonensis DSM 18761]|jgi:prepilin-type N-terminal cleavage/methylation domain-containing protein|uniref:Prepilin-type N-terminal cleavage/methylation domain-containing protein n=1 Tax=Thermoanaerobacter uzonensis DSM 18761 TaxID=1123369 RepID=A0A1M4VA57_9THEO|nr:prepilin-type N-terminal cleavage/methylation domain-containing protein [Thermoanaerobacter uzonensis]SHE65844.1 prepilin-type N-terminal cleavage/methylation domain-containing protein [Thermoanaerobacter uzonensis DSM 18761]
MKRDEGLTLIELVTVLAIFTVIVLIVIPSTDFFDTTKSNIRLTLIAREVVNDLRYIQHKSIFERENLYFEIKPDKTGYYINRYEDDKNIKTKDLPKGILIEKNIQKEIRFNHMGVPSTGGCTITLKNDKKEIYITLLPATGRIMIKGNY